MNAATTKETLAGSDPPTVKLMLKWVGIVLVLAALTVVVVGLFLPREWHVEQSVDIEAEVAQIHTLVADVERWDAWMFEAVSNHGQASAGAPHRYQRVVGYSRVSSGRWRS